MLMDQQRIGKYVAERRKALGLTQAELARQLGVTDKSVSKWERGVCLPDVSLYQPLCRILGITLNEFFAGGPIAPEDEPAKAEEAMLGIAKDAKQKRQLSWKMIAALGVACIALFAGFVAAAWRLGWFDRWSENYIQAKELSEEEWALVGMLNGYGNAYVFDFSASQQYENLDLIVHTYRDGAPENEEVIGGLSFQPEEGEKAAGVLAIVLDRDAGIYRVCIRDDHYGALYSFNGEISGLGEDSPYNLSGTGPQLGRRRIVDDREIPLLEIYAGKDELETADLFGLISGDYSSDGRSPEEYGAEELQKIQYAWVLCCRFY